MAVIRVTKCSKCIGLGKTKSGKPCKACKGTGEIEVRPVVTPPVDHQKPACTQKDVVPVVPRAIAYKHGRKERANSVFNAN